MKEVISFLAGEEKEKGRKRNNALEEREKEKGWMSM